MNRHRTTVLSATALSITVWAYACGDGAVEPPPFEPPEPPPPPATPTTVTVTPETVALSAIEDTAQLAAEVRDQNGQVMAGTTVSWSSSDLLVAVVNAGMVKAVDNGTVTVTATAGSASGTAEVTVAQEAEMVTMSPAADTLLVGDTVRLSAAAVDANGHSVPNAEFAWASGDTLVAMVDAEGLVTGVSAGEAEITATSAEATGRATLTVAVLGPPAVIAVSPVADTITVGETVRLAAEAFDANGFAVGAEFAWSSSNVSVARVDASGLVTALAPGRATVTAAAGEARGTSDIWVVTVAQQERAALVALYEATDGPNWVNSENWLTDAPLGEWYGVSTDGSRRVSEVRLGNNGLSGSIPSTLANLANLEILYLAHGDLTGPIPPELGNLANLKILHLADNDLTGPIPSELGNLTNLVLLTIRFNELTGAIPPKLGNLASLERLDLYFNDLRGPIPSTLGNLTNLQGLTLMVNKLSGPIPSELGNLANLETLDLLGNQLTGPIPPELGNLTNLLELTLKWNELSGPIPSELGDLANLETLDLFGNELTGPIPPELGNLTNLLELTLSWNELSGPIPSELGDLATLETLDLLGNQLTGPIPPELGNLATLEDLGLSINGLSGPVPAELGELASLTTLALTSNPKLSGTLPASLKDLRGLEVFQAGGTDLCAPPDPAFQAWLQAVRDRWVGLCGGGTTAYLTQAVQSREFPVPLVAGERALLRVFVTANQATTEGMPPVRARFFLNGTERHVVDISASSANAIPTDVDEGDLSKSANAEIPGAIVRPGLEMVVEVDPDGTLDPALGVTKRIPETGRMAVEVREMPVLDITAIPFLWSANPDSAVVDAVDGMAADPEGHPLLEETRILLPVGDIAVTAHEPVVTASTTQSQLATEVRAIQAIEGRNGHYMGLVSPTHSLDIYGVGQLGGRVSYSVLNSTIIAHELGHNMSLGHPPCSVRGLRGDPFYPNSTGEIGSWGYDFRTGSLVPPSTWDIMSYCPAPRWISGYYFTGALRYRLVDEGAAAASMVASPNAKSLLLWGGVAPAGNPFLNPAFVVDAPAGLPESAGDHTLTGRDAAGGELFSLGFAMPEVADGDGRSSVAFVLPVRPEWAGVLSSITLSGPDGDVTLDEESNRPMAILRNPSTGQVRGFLRDLPPVTQAAMDAAGRVGDPGFEVLFSRGIPDAEAWRR